MAYTVYKNGDFFRFKDNHEKVFLVVGYDKADGTVRGTNPIHGESGWTKNDKVEPAPHQVRVMSIKKGKHNAAFKPETQAAKLRKALAKVAELEDFRQYL